MPSPSYWPVIVAFGLPIMAYGIIYHTLLIVVGAAITLLGLFGWALEPSMADDDRLRPAAARRRRLDGGGRQWLT